MTDDTGSSPLGDRDLDREKKLSEIEKLGVEVTKIRVDISTAARLAQEARIDSDKKAAELAKLKAERVKLRVDTRNIQRTFIFERWKTVATFITTIVALGGLLATLRSQYLTAEADSLRRQTEGFIAAQKQLGESAPALRLSAVASLETYMQVDQYRDTVTRLLITALEVEKDEAIKSLISSALARNATPAVIHGLASRNRQLKELLREQAAQLDEDFETWERMDSSTAEVQRAADVLQANGQALVEVLNEAFRRDKAVRGVDLSGVMFSLPKLRPVSELRGKQERLIHGYSWRPKLTLGFVDGIRFEDVNFSRAKLSWLTFKDCAFHNVNLDRARLVDTLFNGCNFSGSTSLQAFVAVVQVQGNATACMFVGGPVFGQGSKVDVQRFQPAKDRPINASRGHWFAINDSSWSFSQTKVMSVPTSPSFQPSGSGKLVAEQRFEPLGPCKDDARQAPAPAPPARP